jgi:hypothetical protein
MLRTPIALLCALVLTAALLAAPALASKRATHAQARAVAKAVRTTSLGGANKVDRRWYRVTGVRISSLSPSWAIAHQRATRAGRGRFQPAYFILIQPQGARSWTVVSLGTALVGCGAAPDSVLADLLGVKRACPPGEGIRGS